ncbi:mannose-1-phosphate guanylyltransferase/mannose-1-phosphate guanylyltransferase/mannose-6-phosphate isomerase [Yoonia maritima]|uniref:mannose-1-phosphate guanylyltransferase n=1 Tax=Yoonia maritima TaxID=1435347 RepID=A0A2T0VW72_9RHOB|nr:mannose-1-phosphate guanylyltransferase/mannose-6-phosphate isomerase [Yoonia maritima]PRY75992.1 mannose-1-phosphate guanylyltransferase/mannose-1-phosphate guanylyltransferase/mannose-6-phosphate isomerase [Yoonia maritima]
MESQTITPVILCGGSGTRLWPLSRKSYPKQFAPLIGATSLFQASVKRLSGARYAAPVVVTGDSFRFTVVQQLDEISVDPGAVLIEPTGKDTGPAILAAALHIAETNPKGLMLVAPSDHVIPDDDAFANAIASAVPAAEAGDLVTFGIKPDRPETGYGYLELEHRPGNTQEPRPLKSFVEKPNATDAATMMAEGCYLWNAGIFLFSVQTILDTYRANAPDMYAAVNTAVNEAKPDLGFLRLAPEPWAAAPSISIDYAVMEKASNLSVVPYGGRWSDLGDWAAVWRETETKGLSLSGAATAIDCENTLLRSEVEGQAIVAIGLDDIVAVAMPDAVLVSHKSRTQDVKSAVRILKKNHAPQAEHFPKDHRPWGWFESLAMGERFQVKRIVVNPGASLSLQSHHHRSEHWIVVQGTAKVSVNESIRLVSENQSIYVPLGAQHRLENPGKLHMVLIEVQTGGYLGEDDIIRHEDVYART